MHSLPLSPPGDPQDLQGTIPPLSPHQEGSLLTHPPVSPSSVLPTPPSSSETSPMMCKTGKGAADHSSSAENMKEKEKGKFVKQQSGSSQFFDEINFIVLFLLGWCYE